MLTINDTTGLNLSLHDMGLVIPEDSPQQYIVNVLINPAIPAFTYLLTFVSLLVLCIVLHEVGHWFALKRHCPDAQIHFGMWEGSKIPKLWTGNEEQYDMLTNEQRMNVYLIGMAAGFVPVGLSLFINPIYMALLIPYVLGMQQDLKLIIGIIKEQNMQVKR